MSDKEGPKPRWSLMQLYSIRVAEGDMRKNSPEHQYHNHNVRTFKFLSIRNKNAVVKIELTSCSQEFVESKALRSERIPLSHECVVLVK